MSVCTKTEVKMFFLRTTLASMGVILLICFQMFCSSLCWRPRSCSSTNFVPIDSFFSFACLNFWWPSTLLKFVPIFSLFFFIIPVSNQCFWQDKFSVKAVLLKAYGEINANHFSILWIGKFLKCLLHEANSTVQEKQHVNVMKRLRQNFKKVNENPKHKI